MPIKPHLEFHHPDFATMAARVDIFDYLEKIDGVLARKVENRETIRFELNGQTYYRKFHKGVGWTEIGKNWLRLRSPIFGARNEWLALNRLQALGLDSLTPIAFGVKGINPANQESFLVTRELADTIKLHELLKNRSLYDSLSYRKRCSITRRVAEIAKSLHEAGINHRDFYFCHFLIAKSSLREDRPIKIYLVDLHRAQMRRHVPTRWRVKDIGSLHFSSRDLGISTKEYIRFLTIYFEGSLRDVLSSKLMKKIKLRSDSLYTREQRLRARGLRP